MFKNLRWKLAQRAELAWWKNYLGKTSVEEYIAYKKNYWNEFLKQLPFTLPANAHLLDAGCGPAGITMLLNENYQSIDAIDPLIAAYREKLPVFTAIGYGNVNFHAASIEEFNPGKKYDVIFCINVINHTENIHQALLNLRNLITDNGYLVITSDVHRWKWLKKLFSYLPLDVLHPHQYDIPGFRNLFKSQGLAITNEQELKERSIFNYQLFICKKVL